MINTIIVHPNELTRNTLVLKTHDVKYWDVLDTEDDIESANAYIDCCLRIGRISCSISTIYRLSFWADTHISCWVIMQHADRSTFNKKRATCQTIMRRDCLLY